MPKKLLPRMAVLGYWGKWAIAGKLPRGPNCIDISNRRVAQPKAESPHHERSMKAGLAADLSHCCFC
jgi:hypothetical protein